MSAPTRPRRRDGLYSATARGRFVVLDVEARQLAELHPEVRDLWPLLDGSHTLTELADLWRSVAQTGTQEERLRTVEAVTEQLAASGLLAPNRLEEGA